MKYLVHYLISTKRVRQSKLIFMGRSLGGLFALNLSSMFKVKATILISTFYSIKEIVKGKLGGFFSAFFKEDEGEPFELIKVNLNKTLIIHGQEDKLVRVENAEMLHNHCKSECYLEVIPEMGHEIESIFHDLIHPMIKFFEKAFKDGERDRR